MTSNHILGMEPDSVLRQVIRNYFAGQKPDRAIGVEDIFAIAMEFNRWLVSTNETLQKLVLDKINTTLPAPILCDNPELRSERDGLREALRERVKRPNSAAARAALNDSGARLGTESTEKG